MYIHVNDRSDLDQVVAVKPGPDGYSLTRLQDLERTGHPRRDVVLINGTRSGQQYIIEVTPTGFVGDLWILDILDEKQIDQVEGIAFRMRANALRHEAAQKLLVY